MIDIKDLLNLICFGDFGLFTLTPKYLFTVLLPIMFVLELMGKFIDYLPIFEKATPRTNQFLYMFLGLGCTTVALVSLDSIKSRKTKARLAILLILLVPCSSKLAIILTYASMVSPKAFLTYLFFTIVIITIIYKITNMFFPLNGSLVWSARKSRDLSFAVFWRYFFTSLRNSCKFIYETAKPFCLGSIIISTAMYFDWFAKICQSCGPLMESFFNLPASSLTLFLLNIIKRDFGSASLINIIQSSSFSWSQITVCLLMLTFFVPCFNSTILLFKQEKLPNALCIWFGSLFVSVFIGKIASIILI